MKPMIYIAANGQEPSYVPMLSEHYKILHPGFTYEGENFADFAIIKNPIEQAFSADFYGIGKADVLIYDVDTNPGNHFIAWAFSLGKPVIAVSQCLDSPGPYWGLAITSLIKPDQVFNCLKYTCEELERKRQAEIERNQKIIEERSTKEPLQPKVP